MVDDDIGEQYLDQFDVLDLSDKAQRRMGVYALKEFYATVMADIGREFLGIEEGVKRSALDGQWSQILSRLESLDDLEKPKGSDKAIHGLKQYRNNTHHNTDFNPPQRQLEEARELAPDWRTWLLENGQKYQRLREELDPRGTIIEMAKSALREITAGRDIYHAEHELEDVQREADALMEQLNDLEQEDGEITLELIYVLRDAIDLRQDMDDVREAEAAIDTHLSMEVDRIREEAAFQRAQNDSS